MESKILLPTNFSIYLKNLFQQRKYFSAADITTAPDLWSNPMVYAVVVMPISLLAKAQNDGMPATREHIILTFGTYV